MEQILSISTSIAFVVFLWLHTEWAEEYLERFSVDKWSNFLYYRDYKNYFLEPQDCYIEITSLKDYIIHYHNSFLTRMLFCPYCMIFWISLFCLITKTLEIAFFSTIFYLILSILAKYNNK